jgi:hypothetical protein
VTGVVALLVLQFKASSDLDTAIPSTTSHHRVSQTTGSPTTASTPAGGDQIRTLYDTLVSDLGDRYDSIGISPAGDRVEVELFSGAEETARDLDERYGGLLEITVGHFPYPLPDDAESACPAAPTATRSVDLAVAVVSPSGPIRVDEASGRSVTADVEVLNVSDERVTVSVANGWGLLSLDGVVVGGAPQTNVADDLTSITLNPADQTTLAIEFSTASCEPTLGYQLPPGDYVLGGWIYAGDGSQLEAMPAIVTLAR